MNSRLYKVIWSKARGAPVVVAECLAGGTGRKRARRRRVASWLAASTLLASPAWADTLLPGGAQIVHGSAAITTSGNVMDVHQSSDRLIANWRDFSIGAGATVNFRQPGSDSVALNRVTGGNPSLILGALNANGNVFLVNPGGIVFGRDAQVDVGGLVASTLDISNRRFLAGDYRFTGTGGGEIVNQGALTGNVLALIAPTVRNQGTMRGDTALAGGTDVMLDFDGDGLISVEVKGSTVATLVENSGLIQADGGTVVMTARGAAAARSGVVNNTGTVEARAMASRNGRIVLLGDMEHGTANVGGRLRAKSVETSAATVRVQPKLKVRTDGGRWLIDPTDIRVDQAMAEALMESLQSGDVTVATSAAGAGRGDIFVNAGLQWDEHQLAFEAHGDVFINAPMSVGGTAALHIAYGLGDFFIAVPDYDRGLIVVDAPVTLAQTATYTTQRGFMAPMQYTIITDAAGLQQITANPNANYVLGNGFVAGVMEPLAGPAVGAGANPFTGIFEGLGHTISNVTIHRPATPGVTVQPDSDNIGFFRGVAGFFATVQNLTLENVDIIGRANVGGLVGRASATINNVRVTGTVLGDGSNNFDVPNATGVGGIVGFTGSSTMLNSYADVDVSGHFRVGALFGQGGGIVLRSEAHGQVTGFMDVGGAVGNGAGVVLEDVLSNVAVNGLSYFGNFGFANHPRNIGGAMGSGGTTRNVLVTGSVTVTPHPELGDFGPDTLRTHAPITPQFILAGETDTSNSFFLAGNLPEVPTPVLEGQSPPGGRELSLAEATSKATYVDAGWDFARVWGIIGGDGALPVLRNAHPGADFGDRTALLVNVANLSRTYGDANPSLSGQWMVSGCDACIIDIGFGASINPQTNAGTYAYGAPGTVVLTFAPGESPGDFDLSFAPTALTINRRMLELEGLAAASRVYDRTNVATLSSTGNLTGILFGDDVRHVIANNQGFFDDRHAGVDREVQVAVFLEGADAGNYLVDPLMRTPATISPREVSLNDLAVLDRVYDGTDLLQVDVGPLGNVFAEDLAGVELLAGSARLPDKNAGDARPVELNLSLVGEEAHNYRLPDLPDFTVDILRRQVGVTGTYFVNDKTYDGTTGNAPLEGLENLAPAAADVIADDDLFFDVANVVGSYPSKNFDFDPYQVTLDGLMLGGVDADNYFFSPADVPQRPGRINPRRVDLIGVRIATKEYDGNTSGALADEGFLQGVIAGDDVVLRHVLPPVFADKDAGNDKPVRVITSIEGADGRNYFIPFGAENAFTGTILARPVGVVGGGVENKIYDGTVDATFAGTPGLINLLDEDVGSVEVIVNSASFETPDASPAPKPVLLDVSLLGDGARNYVVADAGSYLALVFPKEVTPTAFGVADKVYDGTTVAVLTGNPDIMGIVPRDIGLAVLQSEAHFDDKNVGQNKPVLPGFRIDGPRAGNYRLLDAEAIGFAAITPRLLEVRDIGLGDREYDTNVGARVVDMGVLATPIDGDDVRIASLQAEFETPDAGEDKPVHLISTVLAGADGGNYFTEPQQDIGVATIRRRPVSVRGFDLPSTKVYDGETAVEIDARGSILINVFASDAPLVRHTINGAFVDDPDVGTRLVGVDVSLTGLRANNYFVQINDEYLLQITPRELRLGEVDVQDKIYDGTTAAFLGGPPTLLNVVPRDAGMVDFLTTAQFETRDAGALKTVLLTGTLTGPRSHNYVIAGEQVALASISPRPVELSGYRVAAKEYDGNRDATFAVVGELAGVILGDDVRVNHPSSLFDDKNAGEDKEVIVENFLVGNDRENYTIAPTTPFRSAIGLRVIDVQGSFGAVDRAYDTTTRVELAGLGALFLDPLRVVAGDDIFLDATEAFGQIDTKNAGRNRMVALMDIELVGADAQNYAIARIPRSTVDIEPALVSLTGFRFGDKQFDGTTRGVVLDRGMLNGVFPGDVVDFVFDAAFENAGPGRDIPLEVLNVLVGPDAGNYDFDGFTQALLESQTATIFQPGGGFVFPPEQTPPVPPQTPDIVIEIDGVGPIVIVPPQDPDEEITPPLPPPPASDPVTEPEEPPTDEGPQFQEADPVEAEDFVEADPVEAEDLVETEPAQPETVPPPETPAEQQDPAARLDRNIAQLVEAERLLVDYLDQLTELGETTNPAVFQRLATIRALLSQFRQRRAALEAPVEEAPAIEEAETPDADEGAQVEPYPEVEPSESYTLDDINQVLTLLLLLPQLLAELTQDDGQPEEPADLEQAAEEAATFDRERILEFIRRGTVVLPSGEDFAVPPELLEGVDDIEARLLALARFYLALNLGLSDSDLAPEELERLAVEPDMQRLLAGQLDLDEISDEGLGFLYFLILNAIFELSAGLSGPSADDSGSSTPAPEEAPSEFQEDDPEELGDGEKVL